MGDTNFRGPLVSMGVVEDNTVLPTDGPTLSYQGDAVFDGRFAYNKDSNTPNRGVGFFSSSFYVTTDNIPMISSTTTVAAAQASQTTGFAIALNTTALGGSAAGVPSVAMVPLVPQGTTVATAVLALDFGFTTGTTVASSSTVVVVDTTMFKVGQWIVIGGAGNTANTTAIITQVTSITNATTIKINPVAVGALSQAPIGQANVHGAAFGVFPPATQFGPSAVTPNGVAPYLSGGAAVIFDPVQAITRNITVTGNTTVATAAFLVTGYDIYGNQMAELLTAANTTVVNGKKAFKYLLGIQCTATASTGTYAFGVGDIFGINVRASRFETLTVSWNGKPLSANAGFTAALAFTSAPANNTSNDVRGTLSVVNFTAFNSATSNATGRLFIGVDLPLLDTLNSTSGTTGCQSTFGLLQPTS